MYKHKPGIQMDEHGFSESKNITGQKVEDLRHMIYGVLEPMIMHQETEDKNLKLRIESRIKPIWFIELKANSLLITVCVIAP